MGGAESNLQPAPAAFPFMSVSLRMWNKVRVLYGTANEINAVRQAISDTWAAGIYDEKVKYGYCYQFKIGGSPFYKGSSSDEAAAARNLACRILENLYKKGWKCLVSSDLTRASDLTTWVLQKMNVNTTDKPFACISISSYDKLQLINVPIELHGAIHEQILSVWSQGISKDKMRDDNIYEIQMSGSPWIGTGYESVEARLCLQRIITVLDEHGWELYTSSNIKSTADTLFFKHAPLSIDTGMRRKKFFIVSLNRTDRLRVIGAQEQCVSIVKQAVAQFWKDGIKKEKDYCGSHELKLRGDPWWSYAEEGVNARYVLLKILEALCSYGWMVTCAIDISRRLNDKSIIVFEQCEAKTAPFICLSLNDIDKIRLINAPGDVLQAARQVIASKWPFGISDEKQYYMNSWQWKLREIPPWADYGYSGHSGLHGRSILLFLIETFHQMKWRLVLSADVSAKYVHQKNGPDYPIDVHSLYFMYDPTMEDVMPNMGDYTAEIPTGPEIDTIQPSQPATAVSSSRPGTAVSSSRPGTAVSSSRPGTASTTMTTLDNVPPPSYNDVMKKNAWS